jgi:NADP-dependent 3-hydroxy acid dehydrogenase YdfG
MATKVKAQILDCMDKLAILPDAIARAIAFAIEQPADVDVGQIVVRPCGSPKLVHPEIIDFSGT